MKNLNIHFADDNGTRAPLFHQYPVQMQPQPAFLEFEPDDDSEEPTLTADWNAEIGNGVPSNVFNRKVLRWSIPANTDRQRLIELSEHSPLVDALNKIRAGYDCDPYAGGTYTEEASEAIYEVERIFDSLLTTVSVWLADEWISQAEIDIQELIKAGSVETYASLCDSPDADQVVIGDLSEAVAKQLERYLESIDDEDCTDLQKQAAEILKTYQEKQ